ncbi:MAG TPA: phosphate ABC transporter permease subunit PstC [Gemmatimonadaceae bacterium]|nr:phosphate ABC transporter permease subunit PstC [Gemmatimonadaceae bacterium]
MGGGGEVVEGRSLGDQLYRWTITAFAACIPLLLLLIAIQIGIAAWPTFREFGPGVLLESTWDPNNGQFGVLPAIFGTLVSSFLALLLATPLALGVAIFLSEFAPQWLRTPVAFLVDLLAAIPSVIYGLWGIFFLIPVLREYVVPVLKQLPLVGETLFGGPSYGNSMLAAVLILTIMILPYTSSVAREVLLAVPRSQREAALALGATQWETIRDAVVPYAKSGIIGGVILGLGRAIGETMAVTMVIGNVAQIESSLLAPAYTMASLIANEFGEASGGHLSALMAVGFALFVITLIVNAIARWLVWQVSRERTA